MNKCVTELRSQRGELLLTDKLLRFCPFPTAFAIRKKFQHTLNCTRKKKLSQFRNWSSITQSRVKVTLKSNQMSWGVEWVKGWGRRENSRSQSSSACSRAPNGSVGAASPRVPAQPCHTAASAPQFCQAGVGKLSTLPGKAREVKSSWVWRTNHPFCFTKHSTSDLWRLSLRKLPWTKWSGKAWMGMLWEKRQTQAEGAQGIAGWAVWQVPNPTGFTPESTTYRSPSPHTSQTQKGRLVLVGNTHNPTPLPTGVTNTTCDNQHHPTFNYRWINTDGTWTWAERRATKGFPVSYTQCPHQATQVRCQVCVGTCMRIPKGMSQQAKQAASVSGLRGDRDNIISALCNLWSIQTLLL